MATTQSTQDLAAILLQLKATEAEKDRLNKELEATKQRLDEEQRVASETKQKMGKLQEGKRNEMQHSLDTGIRKWLDDIMSDENLKKQFEAGLTRIVDETNEENGVWQVACCASNIHLRRMQELEEMKDRYEKLAKGASPEFERDESRKRPREEEHSKPRDVWEEFEMTMRSAPVVPPPTIPRHPQGGEDPLSSYLSRVPASGGFNPAI